jgi:hypothetical protein
MKNERIRLLRIEEVALPEGKAVCAIMNDPTGNISTPWTEKALADTIKWMQQPENANIRPPGMFAPEFHKALIHLQDYKVGHGIPLDAEKFEPGKKSAPKFGPHKP